MKKGQKEPKIDKTTQFLSFSIENVEIPALVEKQISGKDWINWGADNRLPYYLYGLYEKSALMQSIINTTINFVVGNSIESNYKPNEDETWEDLIRNISLDYMLYNGFAIQVFYNKMGGINRIGWLDMRKCRTDEEHTVVYYSKEFGERKSCPKYITFPVWKRGQEYRNESAVFLYTGSKRTVYPLPRYSGSIAAIETSIRIDNFHLNAIKNNFSNNTIVSWHQGVPDEDTKKRLEKQFTEKFSGDENAGRVIFTFDDGKENGVEITNLSDDNFDKKYDALKAQTITSIFTGFSAPSQLFGYAITGNVFSKQEYQEAFDLYSRLQITPIQNLFTRVFELIWGHENVLRFIPFELTAEDNEENVDEATKINPNDNNE